VDATSIEQKGSTSVKNSDNHKADDKCLHSLTKSAQLVLDRRAILRPIRNTSHPQVDS
jgi:hypothetical protein